MKRFISGFLFGALLFAVPAIANNSKTLEAVYNNIKLSVYGQVIDTQGNEPFIVEGRTYVPARYVAEAMGGVVKWNETENTVEVVKPEAPEMTKLTSDGLEAKYDYTTQKYVVRFASLHEKYPNVSLSFTTDKRDFALITNTNSPNLKTVTPVQFYNDSVAFPYDEYESKVLPLFK